jgi:anti-sigma factor RsiW
MTDWTDARLRAYLRGELDPDDMDEIEGALADQPELEQRLLALADGDEEEISAGLVRDAFAGVEALPVPAAMTAAVMNVAAPTNVVDFGAASAARRLPRWGWPQLGAMAASLAVGVFVGQGLISGGGNADGALVIASANGTTLTGPVAAMLDQAASGVPQQLAGLGKAQIVITFRDGNGQICRDSGHD